MGHIQRRSGILAAALLGLGTLAAAQTYDPMRAARPAAAPDATTAVALNPDFGDLPDTAGVEETYYQCVACHSTAIIKQQRITDARWDYLWTWMVEHQNMPETDAETREVILTYLKRHFSAER